MVMIGTDFHKRTHTAVALDEVGRRLAEKTVPAVLAEQAMGVQALILLATLNAACDGLAQFAQAIAEHFRQHPDYAVITSFPGLGEITDARVLAELGDDRTRFADARALKAYAGSAPVTRASGRSHTLTHRRIKNDHVAAVGYTWAFMA